MKNNIAPVNEHQLTIVRFWACCIFYFAFGRHRKQATARNLGKLKKNDSLSSSSIFDHHQIKNKLDNYFGDFAPTNWDCAILNSLVSMEKLSAKSMRRLLTIDHRRNHREATLKVFGVVQPHYGRIFAPFHNSGRNLNWPVARFGTEEDHSGSVKQHSYFAIFWDSRGIIHVY